MHHFANLFWRTCFFPNTNLCQIPGQSTILIWSKSQISKASNTRTGLTNQRIYCFTVNIGHKGIFRYNKCKMIPFTRFYQSWTGIHPVIPIPSYSKSPTIIRMNQEISPTRPYTLIPITPWSGFQPIFNCSLLITVIKYMGNNKTALL